MTTYKITAIKAGFQDCAASKVYLWDRYGVRALLQETWYKIEGGDRLILYDGGFDDVDFFNENAEFYPHWPKTTKRDPEMSHIWWKIPEDERFPHQLKAYNIDRNDVTDLVISHLHYDHCSNIPAFPKANIWVHDREWTMTTDPRNKRMFPPVLFPRHIMAHLINEVEPQGRFKLVSNTEEEIAPNVKVFWVGAHTPGTQSIEIETDKGKVILTGDICFHYNHIEYEIPIGFLYSVYEWWDGIKEIKGRNPQIIVPSHDRKVFIKFKDGIIA